MTHPSAPINNAYYEESEDLWWGENQPLNLLETVVNPGRVGYFARKIREAGLSPAGLTALEVGCGGGILTEEIARLGFRTTGIDPAPAALRAARAHAARSGLPIDYVAGSGERLPFPDHSFDVVFCCDVLEHVRDLDQVIAEISRVLKPGGTFFFDTINRTLRSKLIAIKLWQDWPLFAFMPKNLHVWEMFIRPAELRAALRRHGMETRETVGLAPAANPLKMLYYLRQRASGARTLAEVSRKIAAPGIARSLSALFRVREE